MTLATSTTANTYRSGRRRLGRISRIVASASFALVAIGGATAGHAAAASNDPRIAPYPVSCANYPSGIVRTSQPFVLGTRATYETIYWQPVLQQWTGKTWINVAQYSTWITFRANNQGSYQPYYANYKNAYFENVSPGYYRIAHIIFWSSTGEYGSAPESLLTWCQV